MKNKLIWLMLVLLIITIIVLSSIFYLDRLMIKNNSKYCRHDSDCEGVFLNCGCKWKCFNKNIIGNLEQCMRECPDKLPSSLVHCKCIDNRCIGLE